MDIERKTTFTERAKGGAPSGQICPSNTMRLRMINTINIPFFMLVQQMLLAALSPTCVVLAIHEENL